MVRGLKKTMDPRNIFGIKNGIFGDLPAANRRLMFRRETKPRVFDGKSVVITGASAGIGASLAQEFAEAGANLTLFSRQRDQQEAVAEQCRQRGATVIGVVGDVSQPQDCERLIGQSVARFGAVDYLVANAGVSMWARFDAVDDVDVFRELMEVNYLGALHCVFYALPYLKQSGGMMVAISSIQGKIGAPLHTGYAAAKHALQGFCEALRAEPDGTGVELLVVLPHWVSGTRLRENVFGPDGGPLGSLARKHTRASVSVETVSRTIVNAVARRQRSLVIPWKLRLLLGLHFCAPALASRLVRNAVEQQEPQS